MFTKKELGREIEKMYPDFGVCGVDFEVEYNNKVNAWTLDLNKKKYHLKTFIENRDVNQCFHGKQCIPLSLQVNQLRENLEKYMHEHSF
jgi:hypothetical protein